MKKRFILRTGIFHLSKRANDPLEYDDFHNALTEFCENYLKGVKVGGLDIGRNPTILDHIIWMHCANTKEDRDGESTGARNVCGKTPKCIKNPELCPLHNKARLFSKFNFKRGVRDP